VKLAPIVLPAAPGRGKRLSEGALVEASVRARLLGIPLLKLDATVVIVPSELPGRSSPPRERPARKSARPSGVPTRHSAPAGHGLAEAVRSLNEGAALLADARRNGS
jgi:hypothetical protein